MMVFFLAGYGASIALVLTNQVKVLLIVTGVVFFVGAFFVLLVVMTAKSDIEEIQDSSTSLAKKNEELEKINTELDLFAYRVSHDLRGPIASIRGLIEIVRLSKSKEESDFCLEKIKTSTIKLDGFIQDILDLSRNSRTEIIVEPVEVRSIINEVTDSLKYMDHDRKIELLLNCPEALVFQTDRVRLKIILTNLITNAFKYIDHSKAKPRIEVLCARNSASLNFSIKDNGIGIHEDHIEKIFEMFFRGTDKSVGTGLGLYVVQEIVCKLKGQIQVKSQIHEGSEFTVNIPALA
ncbi:hypothetical protein WSM22_23730 [Cytophagales bacterium WSM2-2]|nr:hypothetical protein WSM22_23730 [Cytophagales bacterium WSM2-2]